MAITKHDTMKKVAIIINELIDEMSTVNNEIEQINDDIIKNANLITTNSNSIARINEKFDGSQAKNAKLFNGHEVDEFVFKKDMIGLNTHAITADTTEITITYSTTDGINKEVTVTEDVVVKFELSDDQKHIAIPSSVVLFDVANKAEVTFKDVTFVDGVELPTVADAEYKLLLDIAHIGENWYIKNTSIISKPVPPIGGGEDGGEDTEEGAKP